jgi:hypothetical protein
MTIMRRGTSDAKSDAISRRSFAAFTLGASAMAFASKIGIAHAADPARPLNTHLLVLYASNTKTPHIDSKIADDLTKPLQEQLTKRLQEPPFSAYNSYVLREDKHFALGLNMPVSHTLPNHQVLEVKFAGIDPRSGRVTLHAEVNSRTFLDVTAPPEAPSMFFVAGQKFEDGMLVLAFIVNPRMGQ